jgi:mannan endo-1,4-beta-mannosidase
MITIHFSKVFCRRLPVMLLALSAVFLFVQLPAQSLTDKSATPETRALYENLIRISRQGFMFGHQDTDAYGVGWKGDDNRSDVKDITGSFPAVHGWDLGKIGQPNNIDNVPFDKMLMWIEAAYRRGGVNTISWHVDNPLTGESSWSKGDAVKESLPGGKAHAAFVGHLSHLADFLDKCQSGRTKIPIIFRPWHEHNGDWFWWGKGICSEEDYVKLWKFTVDYLRHERKLHHIIYAFSPDRSRIDMNNFRSSYLYGYPGDDYVDLIGYDNYWDIGSAHNKADAGTRRTEFVYGLKEVSGIAAAKKKVAALTETGLESVTDPAWYTRVILEPVLSDPAIRLAYILVWRNDRPDHHYAPFPGHPAADDFMIFYRNEKTFFESDIQNMYVRNKPLVRK